ncbi:MAG: alpha/beta fold hydrolase [Candidatus Margulisiibacteriota bacterium]
MTIIAPKDHSRLTSPYYLTGKSLFANQGGREVFVKKITTTAAWKPRLGPVIMAPGIACNGNLFRLRTDNGQILTFDHARSFANLLASQGFAVYLWHYPSSELVYNRFVSRHCPESVYYGKRYNVSPALNFDQMVNLDLPLVLDLVAKDAGTERLSWVGFSMGGMLAYAYLAKYGDDRIGNLVAIGSPIRITLSLARLIANINRFSKILGAEEQTIGGTLSAKLHLFASLAALLPDRALKSRQFDFLYEPDNVKHKTLRAFFARIVEPIPSGLENSYSQFIREGFVSLGGDFDYYAGLRSRRGERPNCLFIAGEKDKLAPPESVRLAQKALTPQAETNFVVIKGSGHNDLVIGNNAEGEVWERSLDWLIAHRR